MQDFLNDAEFLSKLYELPVREEYVRIIAYDWDENPIRVLDGDLQQGSGTINIDGNSSMRRTGSLSFVASPEKNDLTDINSVISINRKIRIERGIKNTVPPVTYKEKKNNGVIQYKTLDYQELYGDICWFNEGVYVIFNPNISHTTSGVEISFDFKDKMCLLNGEAGGMIGSSVILNEKEYMDEEGNQIIEEPTIFQIIVELVNHFGKEDLSRIIVSDIDEELKRTMTYIGSEPLYYSFVDGMFYTDYNQAYRANGSTPPYVFESRRDVGYTLTSFTYPGELVADAGNTVTTILDKITGLLGNFEYFYDVEGNFIFREKKNYLNTTYSSTILKDLNKHPNKALNYDLDYSKGMAAWDFSNSPLVVSCSNMIQYSEIKNDYIFWGMKTTGTSAEKWPIRYHLAIDKRPEYGKTHYIRTYEEDGIVCAVSADMKLPYGRESLYSEIKEVVSKDYREELYYQGLESEVNGTEESYYWPELKAEFPKIFDLEEQRYIEDLSGIDWWLDIIGTEYSLQDKEAQGEDISDYLMDIDQYSIDNIGRRTVSSSSEDYNCVFAPFTPDTVIVQAGAENYEEIARSCAINHYDLVQVGEDVYKQLYTGGYANSLYQKTVEELYKHSTMNNTITLTTLPIYHLEPNTRITVNDDVADIHGDFIITSISCPLQGQTMNINACQAEQKM